MFNEILQEMQLTAQEQATALKRKLGKRRPISELDDALNDAFKEWLRDHHITERVPLYTGVFRFFVSDGDSGNEQGVVFAVVFGEPTHFWPIES